MTTEVLTFHGDPDLKAKLLDRITAHEEVDAIAQGTYEDWDGYGKVHRCAVGCSLRDLSDRGSAPTNWHAEMERVLGVPEWLAALEDRVFEGMSPEDAKGWPRRFSEALPVGASLEGLAERLAIRRLKEECLPLSGTWPESIRAQVVTAIEQTIAALESKDVAQIRSAAWSAASAASAARAAAWSAAGSSARSAAVSAAWSAAESARSAAGSARAAAWSAAGSSASAWSAAVSAAWSAGSAARSAAYKRESDRIVEELYKIKSIG